MGTEKSSLLDMFMRVALPVAIGLGVTFWLFSDEFSAESFAAIKWDYRMLIAIAAAIIFAVGRDFGLAWRFHTIAHPQLSWPRAFKVDLMCAFTSAITPSAVGGSALAIFYLNREGVPLGRAATMTLTTLFLDELFFVVFCPIILLLIPFDELFISGSNTFMLGVQVVFWIVYAGIVIYTALLFWGIIIRPRYVARLIKRMFSIRWLRRWQKSAFEMADNMVMASDEIKGRDLCWWLNVFFATVVSWFSRYLVVNALFWGFCPGSSALLVFSRQFVVWVVLMVSPTPGGSGVSEWLFTEYYGDLIGSVQIALIMAIIWRIISYYTYLIAGSLLLPLYFGKKSRERAQAE